VPKWRYCGASLNAAQTGFTISQRIDRFREATAEASEAAESHG